MACLKFLNEIENIDLIRNLQKHCLLWYQMGLYKNYLRQGNTKRGVQLCLSGHWQTKIVARVQNGRFAIMYIILSSFSCSIDWIALKFTVRSFFKFASLLIHANSLIEKIIYRCLYPSKCMHSPFWLLIWAIFSTNLANVATQDQQSIAVKKVIGLSQK